MRKICTSAMVVLCAGIVSTAGADVVMDQIGAADGSDMGGSTAASQDFEDAYNVYDIAAIDDFYLGGATSLNSVSFILNGWNGWGGSGGALGYNVNIYSSIESAGANLSGDVAAFTYGVGDAVANGDWGGAGEHLTLDLGGFDLAGGSYLISVQAINNFADNGQSGIATSNLGDGAGYQANPAGGFGFGPYQGTPYDFAYAIDGTVVPAPAALGLLAIGGLAVRRRR